MPLEAKVTRVLPTSEVSLAGKVTPQVRVEFSVGPHGPFSVTINQADFTADRVTAEMAKVAATINALPQA